MGQPKGQKKNKTKKGQPPPIDKLIKPAIGVGLALLGYQFFKGMGSEIKRINVLDEDEMKEVFFGEGSTGKSYVVLCHDEESNLPISSVFQEAHADGSAPAEFRLVDCNYVLPASEKSIADRFKLNTKDRPTIFLSGDAVDAPQQIPSKHLKTGGMLVRVLRNKLEARAAKIETTQDLRTKCLDKDICGFLLKGTKKAPKYLKDAMDKLLKEFPNVAFAAMDSSVLYAMHLEEHIPELQNEQPRFVVMKKVSGSLTGDDRLKTSVAALPDSTSVSYGSMSTLLGKVIRKQQEMIKVPQLPTVKTRTKKLEQEERAKRERKLQQQQRRQQNTAPSTPPAFQANDGSKEGRKAERERRRAEHRAKTGFKERTPEEIAEMERQRRKRMEEEAKKWNVAPDDAPEEGDPVLGDEDEDGFSFEDLDDEDEGEEEYDQDEEESDGDGFDDEDVIDLD